MQANKQTNDTNIYMYLIRCAFVHSWICIVNMLLITRPKSNRINFMHAYISHKRRSIRLTGVFNFSPNNNKKPIKMLAQQWRIALHCVFFLLRLLNFSMQENNNVEKKGWLHERRKVTIWIRLKKIIIVITTGETLYITGYGLNRPLIYK